MKNKGAGPSMPLVGRRVVVIATGERGNCTAYDGVLCWCVMADREPYGYLPHELRKLGPARRLARWVFAWVWS